MRYVTPLRHNGLMVSASLVLSLTMFTPLAAQQQPSAAELQRANNPLADMVAFNVQNYYVPKLYGADNETANTFWLRFAAPVSRVLVRASLPINTFPTSGPDPESGLGDFNIFGAYLATPSTAQTQFGIGPLLAIPTATDDALGSGKWSLGAASVVFAAPSPAVQFGGLVTFQTTVAGDEDRDEATIFAIQPFGFWQLGAGYYLRTASIWAFNLTSGDYNVPFGFGAGKVIKLGNIVFNIFLEPQFTILHNGIGQPGLQLLTALNLQFITR